MPLSDFKSFVRERPSLANYVNKNEMTWQKFYEMYELYGANNSIWDNYLSTTSASSSSTSIKDMLGMFKNVNMNDLQEGINSLQKGIGYIQDMVKSKTKDIPVRKSSYEPRPMYRHFDDWWICILSIELEIMLIV